MKKFKIFLKIFVLSIFLFSCTQKYDEHFYSERNNTETEEIGSGDFASKGEILVFPDKNEDDFLVSAIDSAKNRIWIEIYTWTKMNKIYSAIEKAKARGLDVRVLMEGNVYGSPYINAETQKFLQKNNIENKYTDNNKYRFTHAKFWLIDDVYYISTGNWTISFFKKNREFIYVGKDEITKNFLEKIFLADFAHQNFVQTAEIPSHIVISPLNSREKIENFIQNSNSEITIYVQTVTDDNILNILGNLKNLQKNVFLCVADNEGNREAAEKYTNLDWKFAINPYLHAKIMISDNEKMFLGSQNFTTNSIENNREIGIILDKNGKNIENIKKLIKNHCN